ncbi:MAG: adenylate/guanylate cyclase domain-containing protein [Pseudomonadota bacterium]
MSDTPHKNSSEGGEQKRRLCAIMFTDIKGFSSMMESDEVTAVGLVKAQREIIRRCIAAHKGEEREIIGDAFLVIFDSAVNAVKCAIDIQRDILEFNQGRDVEKQVWIRIGIHLGDILIEDGSVFGEGVNLAARVEPLAEPGGICITRQVYDQVKHHLEIEVSHLGVRELKNITDVPDIYRIRTSTTAPREPVTFREMFSWIAESRQRLLTAAAVAVLAVGANAYWTFFASHTSYARDVAFIRHAPEPRHAVGRSKVGALNHYYEFTKRGGCVERLVEVTKPDLLPEDAQQAWEFGLTKKQRRDFPIREYSCSGGRVKEEQAYDRYGVMQYRLIYDEDGKIATVHDDKGYIKTLENQIAGFGFEFDGRGREVQLENRNAFGMRRVDGDGAASYRYAYNSDDLPEEISVFDINGNPSENKDGVAITSLQYNGDGLFIRENYFDRYKAPHDSRKGNASVEKEYDDRGRQVMEKYKDSSGELSADNEGACMRRFACDSEGRNTEITTLSCAGNPIATPSGFATVRYEYDGGRVSMVRYFDENNLPTANSRGIAATAVEYDNSGRISAVVFFGPDGKAQMDLDHAHAVHYAYDRRGLPARRSYLGLDLSPTIAGNGYAEIGVQYNERGEATEWAYFDTDGNPTNNRDGFAVVRNEYDPSGNLTSKSFFDKRNEPAMGREDVCHRIQLKYDDKGNLDESRCLDGQGHLISGIKNCAISEYQHDAYGKLTRFECYIAEGKLIDDPNVSSILAIKYDRRGYMSEVRSFDANGEPAERYQGSAIWKVAYDDYGNQIEIATYDRNGNLIDNPKYKAAIFRREFDSRGHELKAQAIDSEGQPTAGIWGFSEIHFTYDDLGHKTSESYFDENGAPTTNLQGIHEHRTNYDDRGRLSETSNIGKDGAPVEDTDGVAFTKNTYDRLGFVARIDYEDTARNPALNRRFGCQAQEFKTDERGNILKIRRLDANGNLCTEKNCIAITDQEFDSKSKMVKQTFKDSEGRPTVDESGAAGYKDSYDASGRILARSVMGPDGSDGYGSDGVHKLIQHYRPDTGRLWYITFADIDGKGSRTKAGADLRVILYDPLYLERQRAKVDATSSGKIMSTRCLDEVGKATGSTGCATAAEVKAEVDKIRPSLSAEH